MTHTTVTARAPGGSLISRSVPQYESLREALSALREGYLLHLVNAALAVNAQHSLALEISRGWGDRG